jgi:hypothetical protein
VVLGLTELTKEWEGGMRRIFFDLSPSIRWGLGIPSHVFLDKSHTYFSLCVSHRLQHWFLCMI